MSNFGKRVNSLLMKLRVDENIIFFAKGETLDDQTWKRFQKVNIVRPLCYIISTRNILKMEGEKTLEIVINTPFVEEWS